MASKSSNSHTGFTLIELLIVVAIIAILAAIAVPSFLEAQVRAKVARAESDMRSLAIALEAYHIDHTAYPLSDFADPLFERLPPITTPISYITDIPDDPFFVENTAWYAGSDRSFLYAPGNIYFGGTPQFDNTQYRNSIYSIASRGPDTRFLYPYCAAHPLAVNFAAAAPFTYDPTNGTLSRGEIFRLGGGKL